MTFSFNTQQQQAGQEMNRWHQIIPKEAKLRTTSANTLVLHELLRYPANIVGNVSLSIKPIRIAPASQITQIKSGPKTWSKWLGVHKVCIQPLNAEIESGLEKDYCMKKY